jgi:hypothetical protein
MMNQTVRTVAEKLPETVAVQMYPCPFLCRRCSERETCTPPPAGTACRTITMPTKQLAEYVDEGEASGEVVLLTANPFVLKCPRLPEPFVTVFPTGIVPPCLRDLPEAQGRPLVITNRTTAGQYEPPEAVCREWCGAGLDG